MKKYIIIAIIIVLAIGGYFVFQKISKKSSSEVQPEKQVQSTNPEETVSGFTRIVLNNYNWEGNGSTIMIREDGHYLVELNITKTRREGILTAGTLDDLTKIINSANVSSLNDTYTGPRKTTRSWIQYGLIIDTKSGFTKSISFNSEDETAPQALRSIVDTIIKVTK